MRRVFKYAVPDKNYFSLNLPKGAKILTVQEQGDELQLWALVEENAPNEIRSFCFVGTGHCVKDFDNLVYINTVQRSRGGYVYHLFEIIT